MCRRDCESVSWSERGCSDRIDFVVTAFVRKVVIGEVLRICSVYVGCCVSKFVVDMACSTGIVRVRGGVYEDVAIEYTS